MSLDLKKVYYYSICLISFFVLMWGVVDLASSSIGLYGLRGGAPTLSPPSAMDQLSPEKGDQLFDAYYQQKMLNDRFWDALARVIIAGGIFLYSRVTVNKLEQKG
jgi:hypothetical protein